MPYIQLLLISFHRVMYVPRAFSDIVSALVMHKLLNYPAGTNQDHLRDGRSAGGAHQLAAH